MVQKLNNIIQTKTKFNHKVDSKQAEKKTNKFEKSLEIAISSDKNANQKNHKIKKKNKSELSPKTKEIKNNQNLFTPFTEKNLPIVQLNNNCENNIDCEKINQDIFFNHINNNDSEENIDQQFPIVPQLLFDIAENEIPQKEIPDKIEAKLQVINEFFQAINIGLNKNIKSEVKEVNILNNNNIANTNNKIFSLQNELTDNSFTINENDNNDKEKNKIPDKLNDQKNENINNKIANEIVPKTEKPEVKLSFNLPTSENKKTDENIQHKVEKNAEITDKEPKKSESKIQFTKKDNPELSDKKILNDFIKEHITEISTNSKNINQVNIKNTTTYNQFGQIRIQEFTQTTLQLVRATPDNTTSTANLVIKPESLGTLFVQITMTDNKAKINIMADTSEAIKTIEQQIGALKEKLSQNGIVADSIDIGFKSKEGEDKFSNNNQFAKQQDKKSKEDIKEYLRALNNFKEDEKEVL
ncbi:MAG: flagellar hook-length control protein FliK [Candidatus Kapabacteria bacterium]|nr:flagellar hook-length control protein FliK [Candidatus Kapabacteria bacterium]